LRLYEFPSAANCRRLTLYLAEKRLDIPRVFVDIFKLEQRSAPFLEKNPAGTVPVLETDDGEYLAESTAIAEYLEELFPDPPMLGMTALQRARVRALERVSSDIFLYLANTVSHTHPFFLTRPGRPVQQVPSFAAESYRLALPLLERVEQALAAQDFLASDRPSIADCTLYAAIELAKKFDLELPANFRALRRWFDQFGMRIGSASEK
jgi:glutathione S-transferase